MEDKIKTKITELKETEKQTIDRLNMLRNEIMKGERALEQLRGAIAISQEYIEPVKNDIEKAKEKIKEVK